jgi:thymidylate kinase
MLVVIEGPDFSGKSTISNLVCWELKKQNIPVFTSTTILSSGWIERLVNWAQEKPFLWAPFKSFIFHLAYVWDYFFWNEEDSNLVIIQQSYSHRVLAYDEVYNRKIGQWLLEFIERYRPPAILAYYLDCPLEIRQERYLNSCSTDPRDCERFTVKLSKTIRLEEALKRRTIKDGYILRKTYPLTAPQCAKSIVNDILKFWKSEEKVKKKIYQANCISQI